MAKPVWAHRTCSVCHRDIPEDEPFLAKSVLWRSAMGNKYVRQRTVALQCAECARDDADWDRKPFTDSPGFSRIGA